MIACDRCGGRTEEKPIKSKKDGKRYVLQECQNGCMTGRFPYSFFPPKDRNDGKSQPQVQAKSNGSNGNGNEAVTLLRSIDTSLKNISIMLAKKTGTISIQPEELHPDEEVFF